MTPEKLFSLFSLLASIGWLLLIVAPRWRPVARIIAPVVIPVLIAIVYSWLMATRFAGAEGGFDSLANVKKLLADDHLLLGGWIHYLAFDLFIGAWEVRDAQRRGIPHLAVIPCLALTFFFGPAGLLLYLVVRFAVRKQIAVEEPDAVAS